MRGFIRWLLLAAAMQLATALAVAAPLGAAEPYLVKDALYPPEVPYSFADFTPADALVFFGVRLNGKSVNALWVSDGTRDGTRLVEDVIPSTTIHGWTVFGSRLILITYTTSDTGNAWRLWSRRLEGSEVHEKTLLFEGGAPPSWTVTDHGALFGVDDTLGTSTQLWVTDGTPAGTRVLAQLDAPLVGMASTRERVYILTQTSLWSSGGTPESTRRIKESLGGASQLTVIGDLACFVAGSEIWVSDGTPDGTRVWAEWLDVSCGGSPEQPDQLTAVGDRILFRARNACEGLPSIWVSDLTPEGTARILDVCDHDCKFDWTFLGLRVALGTPDRFFLAADDGVHGMELWLSDGTAAGTALVKDLQEGEWGALSEGLHSARLVGRRLFFAAGGSLWTSDGTTAGTLRIAPLADSGRFCGDDCPALPPLAVAREALFFWSTDDQSRRGLWALPLGEYLHPSFRRGDANSDGALDLSDAVATLGFLFLGSEAPSCLDAADANDSGEVDLSDAIFTLGFLLLGTAPPPAPFEACGDDPTEDAIACSSPTACS